MKEIAFEIQGSAIEPYRVVFVRSSNTQFSAFCSCPAGENGQYCKHRLAILEGKTADVVSPNVDEAAIVQSWLSGTEIERSLLKMRGLEKEAEQIKKSLSAAKNELAVAMRGTKSNTAS